MVSKLLKRVAIATLICIHSV
ncbi:hypothetical protein D018_4000A, partial [Vibrio parahaemolyticus VP2007-007]